MKKYRVLLTTYLVIKQNPFTTLKILIQDLIQPFFYSELAGRYGCDLILVVNKKMEDLLKKYKVSSKIVVTGDPLIDSIYDNISKYKIHDKKNNKILKMVLMTTAVVEHGLWSKEMWSQTIKSIVTTICKEFSNEIELTLKIHPRSERKEDYEKLLYEIGTDVKILQNENLLDVVNESDLVISYAESWGLWEVLFLEKPIIIVNLFDYDIKKSPFVKEGLAYELKDMNELRSIISKINNNAIDKKILNEIIERYIFRFDNKSGERSALAIEELIKTFRNKQ